MSWLKRRLSGNKHGPQSHAAQEEKANLRVLEIDRTDTDRDGEENQEPPVNLSNRSYLTAFEDEDRLTWRGQLGLSFRRPRDAPNTLEIKLHEARHLTPCHCAFFVELHLLIMDKTGGLSRDECHFRSRLISIAQHNSAIFHDKSVLQCLDRLELRDARLYVEARTAPLACLLDEETMNLESCFYGGMSFNLARLTETAQLDGSPSSASGSFEQPSWFYLLNKQFAQTKHMPVVKPSYKRDSVLVTNLDSPTPATNQSPSGDSAKGIVKKVRVRPGPNGFGFTLALSKDVCVQPDSEQDPVAHNLTITDVKKNSPADLAGLKPDWRLISVNGRQLSDQADLHLVVQQILHDSCEGSNEVVLGLIPPPSSPGSQTHRPDRRLSLKSPSMGRLIRSYLSLSLDSSRKPRVRRSEPTRGRTQQPPTRRSHRASVFDSSHEELRLFPEETLKKFDRSADGVTTEESRVQFNPLLPTCEEMKSSERQIGSVIICEERGLDGDSNNRGLALIRPTLDLRWDQLDASEAERQHGIARLLSIVQVGAIQLTAVNRVYRMPLIRANMIDRELAHCIFYNITEIALQMQKVFTAMTAACVAYASDSYSLVEETCIDAGPKNSDSKENIPVSSEQSFLDNPGEILCEHLRSLLVLCADYRDSYLISTRTLQNLKATHPHLREFLRLQPLEKGVPSLSSCLMLPMELPNSLLIKTNEVKNLTSSHHHDYPYMCSVVKG